MAQLVLNFLEGGRKMTTPLHIPASSFTPGAPVVSLVLGFVHRAQVEKVKGSFSAQVQRLPRCELRAANHVFIHC